jgi:hypothetical protein
MKFRNPVLRIAGLVVFAAGVALGAAFTVAAVWGDIEAMVFDPSLKADRSWGSLSCPVLVTSKDTGTATAKIKNTGDNKMTRTIRVHVSHGHVTVMKEFREKFVLQPGESKRFEWELLPEDAAFGRFILVGAYLPSYHPYPSRRGTCGSLVVDTEWLSGGQLTALVVVGSVLSMAGGLGMWITGNQPAEEERKSASHAMGVMAGAIIAGMVASLLGWWLLAGLLLVVSLFLAAEILRHFLIAR